MDYSDSHTNCLGTYYEPTYEKSFSMNQYCQGDRGEHSGTAISEPYGYTQSGEHFVLPSDYSFHNYNSTSAGPFDGNTDNCSLYAYDQEENINGQQISLQLNTIGINNSYESSSQAHFSSATSPDLYSHQPFPNNSYECQLQGCGLQTNTFRQENVGYSVPYDPNSNNIPYQDDSSYQHNIWNQNDLQGNFSCSGGNHPESNGGTSFSLKNGSSLRESNYSQCISSVPAQFTIGPQTAEIVETGPSEINNFQEYGMVTNIQLPYKDPDLQHLAKWNERKEVLTTDRSYDNEMRDNYRAADNNFSAEQGATFSRYKLRNFKGYHNELRDSGRTSEFLNVERRTFSNRSKQSHIPESWRIGNISGQRTKVIGRRGNSRRVFSKPQIKINDARNKINEARFLKAASSKPLADLTSRSAMQLKAPARPQDRLLNEIKTKETTVKSEEILNVQRELNINKEKQKKLAEEKTKQTEVELRQKLAEEAVKAAPPSKPPETPEEIAREEEIQRKIRESVVILKPECETALMEKDPTNELEMTEELRCLLKSLTTNHLCKLCSVRIVGPPHMASMHYNGKNHLKKLRNFVQTNGRSAGFNMDITQAETSRNDMNTGKDVQRVEAMELMDVDERKYCKVCKVSFSQDSHADMHYKGKNHAKKIKSSGTGNGPEVFECRICCVTVTAQEHLVAHLNGARHKLQVRKLDTTENFRGRNRGMGLRCRWGKKGGRSSSGEDMQSGEWLLTNEMKNQPCGFKRRSGECSDLQERGFKRQGGAIDRWYQGDNGCSSKRSRF